MRRKDREMDEAFALSVIDKCEYATLALVCQDFTPYSITLSIARKENHIYFHCAHDGKKIDCMRLQPKVCLTFVGDITPVPGRFTIGFESAIVFGTASEVTDDLEKIEALRLICQRYTPDNMHDFDAAIAKSLQRTAVWKVAIESISAKKKG